MAWTTPPTFSDGSTASATQLNILSDDLEYLKGITDTPNSPFPSITVTDDGDWDFWFRHQMDYLHYYAYVDNTQSNRFEISIYNSAGAEVADFTDTNSHAAPYTYSGYINVSALTVGDWYRANVDIRVEGTSSVVYFRYLEERSTT